MPKAFRRQPPPPKSAFHSSMGDRIASKVFSTQKNGSQRVHWIHPTKGWRSERVRT